MQPVQEQTVSYYGQDQYVRGLVSSLKQVVQRISNRVSALEPAPGFQLFATTVGTVAAGATVYLGSNGVQATESDTWWRVPLAGTVIGFTAVTNAASPGSGKNYTYTVRLNGASTAMTGQISGVSGVSVTVITNAFSVVAFDALDIMLVTDAGSTVTKHSIALAIAY